MRDDSTPSLDHPLCACGCGQPVGVYRQTDTKRGVTKGQFAVWAYGHVNRKYVTKEEVAEANRQRVKAWRRQRSAERAAERQPRPPRTISPQRKAYNDARYDERRAWFYSLKGNTCGYCGAVVDDPHRLHFHHRQPETKLFEVGHLALVATKEAILAEIAKCDIICSQCHTEVHRVRTRKAA